MVHLYYPKPAAFPACHANPDFTPLLLIIADISLLSWGLLSVKSLLNQINIRDADWIATPKGRDTAYFRSMACNARISGIPNIDHSQDFLPHAHVLTTPHDADRPSYAARLLSIRQVGTFIRFDNVSFTYYSTRDLFCYQLCD